MMSQVRLLAIVGMSGSGKSEIVSHLTEQGWAKVYFGGIIYKEMDKRGIEITPDSQREFREKIREEEGPDFVVKRAMDEAKNLIGAGQRRIVLDGVYSWTEYKILRKEFESDLITIAVITTKSIRYDRVANRPDRPFTLEEIRQRDWTEIENLEKGGPIAYADYYIQNDGTIPETQAKLDEIIKTVLQ